MTPKEKAKELIQKFMHPVRWKMGQEDVVERAKECALILTDEILMANHFIITENQDKFWEEVEKEIINYPGKYPYA